MNRETAGAYATIVPDLRDIGTNRHYQYFRMTAENVDELYQLIGDDDISKLNRHRLPIPSKMRLMIALRYSFLIWNRLHVAHSNRYLGSGDSFGGLAAHYKIGVSTVRSIVHDVCAAMHTHLGPIVLSKPTVEDWRSIR